MIDPQILKIVMWGAGITGILAGLWIPVKLTLLVLSTKQDGPGGGRRSGNSKFRERPAA